MRKVVRFKPLFAALLAARLGSSGCQSVRQKYCRAVPARTSLDESPHDREVVFQGHVIMESFLHLVPRQLMRDPHVKFCPLS